MAKKKVTTVTTEEEIPVEVNPVEEHDKKVLEALETKDQAIEITPEDLVEEKPESQPDETVKEAASAPSQTVDKEAIKAELKEEVTKTVKDEIVSQLGGTKEEKKDTYAEFEKEIWDKEKRTPTYQEALNLVKTQAKEEIKAELNAEIEEENRQKEEVLKADAQAQQELNDKLNKTWDEQLADLVRSGKIPPILDPKNNEVQTIKTADGKEEQIPVEPGKRARYELFKNMYIASEERINNGAEPLTNLKEIFYEHYTGKKQPAGADAPIAGVRKGVSQNPTTSFTYDEIHNKDIADLLREG